MKFLKVLFSILGWLVGVFTGFVIIFCAVEGSIVTVSAFLLFIFFIPPIHKFIFSKLKLNLKFKHKVLVLFVLIIVWFATIAIDTKGPWNYEPSKFEITYPKSKTFETPDSYINLKRTSDTTMEKGMKKAESIKMADGIYRKQGTEYLDAIGFKNEKCFFIYGGAQRRGVFI